MVIGSMFILFECLSDLLLFLVNNQLIWKQQDLNGMILPESEDCEDFILLAVFI